MNLPVICICTAAALVDINRVWAAMGRGPESFTRKLTTNPSPTPTTPATHYLMSDASTDETDVIAWQALAAGALPVLTGGNVWGLNGAPTETEALAATSAAALQVYSASGDVEPIDHANGVLLGRSLYWVPFPEI